MFGCYITKGLSDWQILQRCNGSADFTLSGRAILPDERIDFKVIVRAVYEDTGVTAVDWTEASHGDIIQAQGAYTVEWTLHTFPLPEGGLYRIETGIDYPGAAQEWSIRGENRQHIGVGDLYVITGQSNSAGYGREPVYDPPELGVHLFGNSESWRLAAHPMNDFTGAAHSANLETANSGHSPYLSFARYLKRELGCPIGLVQASLGGSPLSAWNPAEDGTLYRNMAKIIANAGGKIRGVLWYQGCSDAWEQSALTYAERFMNFADAMRKDFGPADLTFLTVQLNRHCLADAPENLWWSHIRETQRQLPHKDTNIYVVPTLDLKLDDQIHNASSANLVIGERLARAALEGIYGRKAATSSRAPDITRARRDGTAVILEFAHARRIDALAIRAESLNNMYRVTDEQGTVDVKSAAGAGATIRLELSRPLAGKARVTLAPGQDPQGCMPFDGYSWLPVLAFHDIVVE